MVMHRRLWPLVIDPQVPRRSRRIVCALSMRIAGQRQLLYRGCVFLHSISLHLRQAQAVKWIRAMEGRSHLEVVKHSSPNLQRSLESAIRLGRPLLIEQCVESMNSVLEPVRMLTPCSRDAHCSTQEECSSLHHLFSRLCICTFVPQILAKNVFRQGPRTLIHIGDKDIDYDPEFRLYLATSIANPHFLPEVSVQVCSAPFPRSPS